MSYAIISPLIMIFVVMTFGLFYFTFLYNFLYVCEFTTDTGGLAFPKAIYHTLTGIYFGEVCLIGLFFITSGARPQGVVMVVVLVLTVLFHIKLSSSFDPLITYLPIDIQEQLASKVQEQKLDEGRNPDEEAQFRSQREPLPEGIGDVSSVPEPSPQLKLKIESPESLREQEEDEEAQNLDDHDDGLVVHSSIISRLKKVNHAIRIPNIPGLTKEKAKELDSNEEIDTSFQRKFAYELTHDERVELAFTHEALRARPPIIWIPDDELGIAKDEIYRTKAECGDKIVMSCEGAILDDKGKIQWLKNPPDYVHIPVI